MNTVDRELEAEIVGYLVLYGSDPRDKIETETIGDTFETVKPEFFTDSKLGELFGIIRDAKRKNNVAPDPIQIKTLVENNPNFTDIHVVLHDLMISGNVTSGSHSVSVQTFLERAKKRAYDSALKRAQSKFRQAEEAPDVVANDLIREFGDIQNSGSAAIHGKHLSECLFDYLKYIEEGKDETRIPTGFNNLDKWLGGGYELQTLNIIAARPGVGKSAMMTMQAIQAAREGHSALIISLEMPQRQITNRIIRQTTGEYDINKDTATKFYTENKDLKIFICDIHANISDIENIVSHYCRKEITEIVFIDYAGIIGRTRDQMKLMPYELLDEISRRLKTLANKLNITIVLLAQINRDGGKEDTEPKLEHLRGSGGLEQNADTVTFLWRPDSSDRKKINLKLVKNRNGEAGQSLELGFDGALCRFSENSSQLDEFVLH